MKKILGIIIGIIVAIVSLPLVFALAGATALAVTQPTAGVPIAGAIIFFVATIVGVARWISK